MFEPPVDVPALLLDGVDAVLPDDDGGGGGTATGCLFLLFLYLSEAINGTDCEPPSLLSS